MWVCTSLRPCQWLPSFSVSWIRQQRADAHEGPGGRRKITGRISVSGDGALPGSTTAVYALPAQVVPATRSISEPVLVGSVVVAESGTYAGSWLVPAALEVGDYLLQVVATPAAGGVLSASTPLRVLPDDARTIMINGSRAGEGEGRRVFAQGTTTNLEGATVQARVKLAGEARYRSGSTRVVEDEASPGRGSPTARPTSTSRPPPMRATRSAPPGSPSPAPPASATTPPNPLTRRRPFHERMPERTTIS